MFPPRPGDTIIPRGRTSRTYGTRATQDAHTSDGPRSPCPPRRRFAYRRDGERRKHREGRDAVVTMVDQQAPRLTRVHPRSYMLSFIAISLGRCHRAMRLPDNIGLQPRPVSWQPRVMVLLEGRARALSSSASSSRALAPPSANPLSPSLVPPSLECPRGTGITPRVQRPCSCADATPAWKRRTARSKGTDSSV